MTRMIELGRQLERAPLRRLEALHRWMEAIEIRPEMQEMLAEALEELRDLTLQLLTDEQAALEGKNAPVRWRDGAKAVRSASGRMHIALTESPEFATTSPPEAGTGTSRTAHQATLPHLLEVELATGNSPPRASRAPTRPPEPVEILTLGSDEVIAALSGSFLLPPPEPTDERRREKPVRNDFSPRSGERSPRSEFASRSGDKLLRNDFAPRSGRVRLGR
ncbi:MAG: hypothetical protein ACKO6N_00390 [Myxococcota bacterium]